MSDAIFTEVLQIGIDTTQFAAQMKEVEAIYANSIRNMPDLASVGQVNLGSQMQSVAAQFTEAAGVIKESSISMAHDVAVMAEQIEVSTANMAAQAQVNVAKTATAMSEGTTTMTRFGTAVERAMFRLPAMALVGTAMLAVFTAIKEPIDFLNEGLHTLEARSDAFQGLRLKITDTVSGLQVIAATPLFTLLLDQLSKLKTWLDDNKSYVENLALAFGNLTAVVIQSVIELAKTDLLKGTFKELAKLAADIAYALNSVFISLTATFKLMDQGGMTFAAALNKVLHPLTANLKDDMGMIGANVDEIVRKHDEDQRNATKAHDEFYAAIDGRAKANIPEHDSATDIESSQERMAEYRNKLSELRTEYDEQLKSVDKQVADGAINLTQASAKKIAVLENEKTAVHGLINTYKQLVETAVRAEDRKQGVEDARKTEQRIGALQQTLSRGSMGSQGSIDKYVEGQEAIAEEKASKERRSIAEADVVADLKLREKALAAEVALVHKAVSEGHMTRQAGLEADIALEKARHEAAVADISARAGAPGSKEADSRQNALNAEQQQFNDKNNALLKELPEARKRDTEAMDAYTAALAKNNIALLEEDSRNAAALGHKQKHIELTREIIALKLQETQAELKAAQAQYSNEVGTEAGRNDEKKIQELQAEIKRLQNERHVAGESGSNLGHFEAGDSESLGDQLKNTLHLDVVAQDWNNANTGLEAFASVLEGASNIMKTYTTAISDAYNAYKKGGAMGAAGSLLSNSAVTEGIGKAADWASGVGGSLGSAMSSVGNIMPVIGPMIGTMFSSITSLFSMGIQEMVTAIHDKIDSINQQAQLGQITLSQQITELQQEKQAAIAQLGGSKKKGAKDELDSILKSLNSEIAQLIKEQQDIILNFNQITAAMSLGTTEMTTWYNTWTQINQQVKQYVDAGGSIATAAQYLNMQLAQQRQQLQDQLNQGDQTAIQDAIQLNTLLTQRLQMMKDEASTEFGMINADSMERRTSNAVKLGSELSKQRAQYALQLADTNNQISLEQQKVTAEGKIFDINKSLAQLQADSNALTIASLNEQLAKYKDMQTLLKQTAGLVYGPGNIPGSATANFPIPGEPSVAGGINVTVQLNGTSLTSKEAGTIGYEIGRGIRSGRS